MWFKKSKYFAGWKAVKYLSESCTVARAGKEGKYYILDTDHDPIRLVIEYPNGGTEGVYLSEEDLLATDWYLVKGEYH
jgi:hypothetical protein